MEGPQSVGKLPDKRVSQNALAMPGRAGKVWLRRRYNGAPQRLGRSTADLDLARRRVNAAIESLLAVQMHAAAARARHQEDGARIGAADVRVSIHR